MDYGIVADRVRKTVFGGKLTSKQLKGIIRIGKAWEKYGTGLDNALAYVYATDHKETGARMQPVYETFARNRSQAAARLENAFKKGQLRWVKTPYWRKQNGYNWVGAGDVQLTHEYNHKGRLRDAVLAEFGKDIHQNPDHVMDPQISAFIMIEGMTKGDTMKGDFTGKALETYVNETKSDYHNARRTVNPGDKSSFAEMAATAKEFEAAIRYARAMAGEKFRGPEADFHDGSYHAVVEMVQRQLRDKGYHEVGTADGRWGTRSAGAVLAFRNDNELPTIPEIDDEFLAALAKSEERYVAPERKNATAQDLRDSGSTDMERADSLGNAGKAIGAVGVGGSVLDQITKTGEKVTAATEKFTGPIDQLTTALYPVKDFIGQWWPYGLAAVGGYVLFKAWKASKNRMEKHRSGEYMSR